MKDNYRPGKRVARERSLNSFLSEKATTFLASDNSLSNTIVVVVSVAIIALYSGYNRPIWIDEFLHFAFAAFSSTSEAIAAIHRSIVESISAKPACTCCWTIGCFIFSAHRQFCFAHQVYLLALS
jgi:hypothetical protein